MSSTFLYFWIEFVHWKLKMRPHNQITKLLDIHFHIYYVMIIKHEISQLNLIKVQFNKWAKLVFMMETYQFQAFIQPEHIINDRLTVFRAITLFDFLRMSYDYFCRISSGYVPAFWSRGTSRSEGCHMIFDMFHYNIPRKCPVALQWPDKII